ncbi:rhamnulokinase family protein [Cryptosporangium japonicum]|uniref:Rhamnulokinase family protein n=1 Tax=Cryptosporangium japonicum TaxID=80872 RepID=A0ABN0UYI3_9ACTN
MPGYLAVDLGAESGRVLAGSFDGEHLDVREIHRFANRPVRDGIDLTWNLEELHGETVRGINRAADRIEDVRSVGVDGWGSDFGLVDADDRLVAPPWHHRTPRTAATVTELQKAVEPQLLYDVTGTQFLPITTACQLLAMRGTGVLERADRLLMLPDLIAGRLSGVRRTEQTIASTTQLWDIRRGQWATEVIDRLELPRHLFRAEVVPTGTLLADLRTHPGRLSVVAVAGHDTACAVAAMPSTSDDVGFVSCGTWSLVGVETTAPITTPEARAAGFTNELGVGGRFRFLSNVNGLWLLQESRRVWASAGHALGYSELTALAAGSAPYRSLIDPDHPSLLSPGDLPGRIAALCRLTGQPVPVGPAEVTRCILDSLACKYHWVLTRAAAVSGQRIRTVHLFGGGAANTVLCRLTAELTGLPVVAGPNEATAIGNLLVQVMADGKLSDLSEARAVVRSSVPLRRYEPTDGSTGADAAYARFRDVVTRLATETLRDETN